MPVVAAVDESDAARGVVEEAAALAAALGEDLHAIHVLSRGEFAALERESIIEERHGRSIEDIEDEAADVARAAGGADVTAVGRIGEPGQEVVEYADEVDASYIVVGGRDRSPIGKVVFGSVTQAILLAADRPVVTVIPTTDA